MITIEISDQLLIRTVLPSDWEDLLRLGGEKVDLTFPLNPSNFLLVLEQENQLVGFIWFSEKETTHEIRYLEVASDHQGQGLGTLLLAVAKEIASQNGKGLELISPERLLSYFNCNAFTDVAEIALAEEPSYHMIWPLFTDKKE